MTRLLHSLACAKYQILTKEPGGRTISKADRFRCGGPALLLRAPRSSVAVRSAACL